MKILFHYDAGEQLRQSMEALGAQGLDVVCCPEGPDQPFLSELAEAEVLWHVLQPIDKNIIAQAPKLKLIQKIGVGVNTIDLDAAGARGIAVCNMPGTNNRADYPFFELNALLARADIVSLHAPLTDSTEHLIDNAAIAQMKTGAILINTSRGGLIDENALYHALTEGKLAAAGLDVFATEPTPRDNPLLSLDNVIVAPHVGWLSTETWARSIRVAVANSLAIDGMDNNNAPLRFRVI